MIIGLPKEIKNNEFRVGLTPGNVSDYIQAGHAVLVEKGAGIGSGYSDEEYAQAGATLVNTAAEAWNAEMVVKVKEPVTAEYGYFREGLILYTYLHLADNEPLTYTFVIRNFGNTATVVTDDVTVTDTFDPILNPITVTLDGTTLVEGTDYTYDATTGAFATIPGRITIPAATYTRDPDTGEWIINPGQVTLTVVGTV